MALLFQEVKDGIQLGKESDKCFVCNKEAYAKRETVQDGLLTNKELFLLNLNGLRHCVCMDHFKGLLGDYALIPKAQYEEAMHILKQIEEAPELTMENSNSLETVVETKEEESKKSAKTTKAAKSSKGK